MKQIKLQKNFLIHLKNAYQSNLQLMRGSEFVFDYALLIYYKCHKTNLDRDGS